MHILDIEITRQEFDAKTPEEREKFIDTILNAMTPEQQMQMADIGKRVIMDDILQRTESRSRTALRTMARAVHVTVNESGNL